MTYSVEPASLTCELTFCVNASTVTMNDGSNYMSAFKSDGVSQYDFTVGDKIDLNDFISYECNDGFKHKADETFKDAAPDLQEVKCLEDSGEFEYPTIWPECVETVTCPDPGDRKVYSSLIKFNFIL